MDSTPSFSHTMEYQYIDEALRSNWFSFVSLRSEMQSFRPRPLDSFQELYNSELERIKILNPCSKVEDIESLVKGQIEAQAAPDWQFHQAFNTRLMTQYVTVVMLSHALCEALINAILAVGLARLNTTELFLVLDKADFKQKWLTAPKALAAAYEFPKSTAIYESLVNLARQRNALVHHKIQLHLNGVKALEGSGFSRRTYAEELIWLNRFFSLPYDLADFSRRSLPNNVHGILLNRHPIERAVEHETA